MIAKSGARQGRTTVVGMFLVGAALLAGCQAASPSGQTLTGTFTLTSARIQEDPCKSPPGYEDVAAGAAVTVKHESGATVGTGVLKAGTADIAKRSCVYPFTVTGLPKATTYFIGVAKRGAISYSAADLAAKGYKVDLHFGTP
ncbi:MAG: hypothetical protein NVSMB32_18620 [Actinomycetota bacterium]